MWLYFEPFPIGTRAQKSLRTPDSKYPEYQTGIDLHVYSIVRLHRNNRHHHNLLRSNHSLQLLFGKQLQKTAEETRRTDTDHLHGHGLTSPTG